MVEQMITLNKIGEELGKISSVTAMTDVTGFGLLGHIIEMAEGSGLTAEISYNKIGIVDGVKDFITQRVFPDATTRNWNSYHEKVRFEKGVNVMEAFTLLPDPQTNGGLLFSVKERAKDEVIALLEKFKLKRFAEPIGKFVSKGEKTIEVKK
jgi:selenide,water dikinase